MNTSFLRFSSGFTLNLVLGLLALIVVTEFVRHGFNPFLIGYAVIGVGIYLLRWRSLRMDRRMIDKIRLMGVAIAGGDLNYRITGIGPGHELAETAWNLNDGRDQDETFFKEIATAFSYTKQKQFHRKCLPEGLHGVFRKSIDSINDSLESMAETVHNHLQGEMQQQISELRTDALLNNLRLSQRDLVEIAGSMEEVEDISAQAVETAIAGQSSITEVTGKLLKLVEMITTIHTSSQKLSSRSDEIFEVLSLIAGIADQTNLRHPDSVSNNQGVTNLPRNLI